MLTLSTIECSGQDGILMVTLNREASCNAINSIMMKELMELWQWLSCCSNHQWRCVVLTGAGKRAFCAGADLKERYDLDVKTWREQHAVLQQAMIAMHQCPIPVIGAINGVAFGGGLELTLACDFAYAADHAVFSQSEVKLGIMPGAMGTQLLPRAVGLRRAKELTLTARSFTAEEALNWGVVNRVFSTDELIKATHLAAQQIVSNAPLAVANSKRSLNKAVCHDLLDGYRFEVNCYNELLDTADRVEGIQAFNQKRAAEFTGK